MNGGEHSVGRMARGLGGLVALVMLGLVVGCGGRTASLSGKASFNGKPIEKGAIRLDPISGTESDPAAAPIANGQYTIAASEGLTAGEYRVMISASQDTGKKRLDRESGQQVPIIQQIIPEKYNTSSELTVKLEAGENSKDFDLAP